MKKIFFQSVSFVSLSLCVPTHCMDEGVITLTRSYIPGTKPHITTVPTRNIVDQLNTIEKQLITREIGRRGLESVRSEILNSPKSQWLDPVGDTLRRTNPIALNITDVFDKKNIETDLLTKKIFNKIQKIENKSGYMPESINKSDQYSCHSIAPTNYLSRPDTRYYWLEDNNALQSTVRVEAQLHHKKALLAFLDSDQK